MMHEAQLYEDNVFVTLTYSNKYLPSDYSVDLRHWQLFFKKLRFSLEPKKLRFYMCAEYGEETLRPHYHAIIFNHDFNDKVLYSMERENKLYTSPQLTKLWPYGLATLGDVTFESAAYVARYVTKKITIFGPSDHITRRHYTRLHPLTKTLHTVQPEFSTMSRRPGLGFNWLTKFRSDVYPSDEVIARGRRMRPPRFYDSKLTEEELELLKRRRKASGLKHKPDQTPARLRVRALVRDARIKSLKRSLKDDDQ